MEKIITDNYAIEFESGYDSLIKIIDKNKYSKKFFYWLTKTLKIIV